MVTNYHDRSALCPVLEVAAQASTVKDLQGLDRATLGRYARIRVRTVSVGVQGTGHYHGYRFTVRASWAGRRFAKFASLSVP